MNTLKFGFITLLAMLTISIFAQKDGLPDVNIYTLDGQSISSKQINNNCQPLILVFVKTNNKDCLELLATIHEMYVDSLKTKGIKLVVICEEYSGNFHLIKTFVSGHDINCEVFVDVNEKLKRAMAIPELPFTVLFNENLERSNQYIGYTNGLEYMICSDIKKCLVKMNHPDDLAENLNSKLKEEEDD